MKGFSAAVSVFKAFWSTMSSVSVRILSFTAVRKLVSYGCGKGEVPAGREKKRISQMKKYSKRDTGQDSETYTGQNNKLFSAHTMLDGVLQLNKLSRGLFLS